MTDHDLIQAMIDKISERLIDGIPVDRDRLEAAVREMRGDLAVIRVGLQALQDHPEAD